MIVRQTIEKKSDARESVLSVMLSKVFSVIPQIKTQNPMPDRQTEADKERGEKREMRGLFPFDHISSFIPSPFPVLSTLPSLEHKPLPT